MSATNPDVPKKGAAKTAAAKIELSGDPRVQLLPPAVRDRAASRSRARTGVLLIVLGALVAAALVAAGTVRAGQAQQALLDANNRGAELLAQQAKYSEAVALDRLIQQAKQLQKGATETEIDFGPLIQRLVSMLPEGAEISSISAVNILPWQSLPAIEGVDAAALANAGFVASLDITLTTVTIQDATNYSRSMRTLTGALGSTINTLGVGVDGLVSSKVTIALGLDAVSGRFDDEKASGGGDAPSQEPTTASEEPTDASTSKEG